MPMKIRANFEQMQVNAFQMPKNYGSENTLSVKIINAKSDWDLFLFTISLSTQISEDIRGFISSRNDII